MSCSSVTCILVRVRPKDVVHSRLYRPFAREEKENNVRKQGRKESEGEIVEKERISSKRDMHSLIVWVCRCGWRSKF